MTVLRRPCKGEFARRIRFDEKGLADFGKIAPGRGRKSWLEPGTVEAVVHDTRHASPDDASTRSTSPNSSPQAGAASALGSLQVTHFS